MEEARWRHRAERPSTPRPGLVLNAETALERARGPLDTLIVSGGIGYVDATEDERLVAHVRHGHGCEHRRNTGRAGPWDADGRRGAGAGRLG